MARGLERVSTLADSNAQSAQEAKLVADEFVRIGGRVAPGRVSVDQVCDRIGIAG